MKKILYIFAIGFLLTSYSFASEILTLTQGATECASVKAKDFSYLFKSLDGLGENQLKQHYTLYLRYVKKLNEINEKLKIADKAGANAAHSEFRDLKIDRSFVNNGVTLHELYFLNLTPQKSLPSKCLIDNINQNFGSYENYIADLKASIKSTRSGWVITAYNCLDGKIENYILESHDLYVPVNIKPILVIDVWEHSYMIDYGIDKEAYINAFFKNVDWQMASKRLAQAVKA